MRRLTLISILMMLISGFAFAGIPLGSSKIVKGKETKPYVNILGQKASSELSAPEGTFLTSEAVNTIHRASTGLTPVDSVNGVGAFGWLTGPDGTYWSYSQSLTESGYYYTATEITIYDADYNVAGTITIDSLPESTNMVQPYGRITTNLFDINSKTYEVLVYINHVGSNYTTVDSVFVYNLSGEVVDKFPGNGTIFSFPLTSYSNYQRYIRMDEGTMDDGTACYQLDIYKPAGYSGGASLEHTFQVPEENLYYMDGPVMTTSNIDGEAYYTLSYYDKPYVSGYDEDYDLILNDSNTFVLATYNSSYELVDSFGVSFDAPEGVSYRFASFGMFSDCDISRNYFEKDGNFNYVVSYYDYVTSQDDYIYSFDLFDNDGTYIKNIVDSVLTEWYELADIEGEEEQMTFLRITEDDSQAMTMVDLPSCEIAAVFPAYTNGERISSTLNRWPTTDGDYQYIISMGSASSDSDGNVIARAGWYNKDTSLDHFVSFNLGTGGQNFTMDLEEAVLSPYLVNTDDEHEYAYLAKISRDDDSGTIETVLVIADGDGEPILTARGDDDKSITLVSFVNTDTPNPEVCVIYRYTDWTYDIERYSLPTSRFAGGSGTVADPYLIATVGDLFQMEADQEAAYKIVADLDFALANTSWRPLESFSGSLDGDNHAIYNFYVNADTYQTGMFYYMTNGAKARNIVFVEPKVVINRFNSYAGTLSAYCMGDSVSNIHVFDGQMIDETGSKAVTAGGIIGHASLYSTIESCSYNDGVIDLPGASPVGGILGSGRTSATITSSLVTGTISGGGSVGGILGSADAGVEITNSRVDANISGGTSIGGIIGYSSDRPQVKNCHVQGTIEATSEGWNGYSAAGIVGYLFSDWTRSKSIIIKNNVSDADIILPEGVESDSTVHRIVGHTIVNESYDEDQTIYEEIGLASNYATADVTVAGSIVESTDSASVEGASVDASEYTKDFFESLSFVYFTDGVGDKNNPWKGNSGLPQLYYEDEAKALVVSSTAMTATVGDTLTLTATVWGAEGDDIDFTSSDDGIAVVEITDIDGGTAVVNVECISVGEAVISVSSGSLSATCSVTIDEVSAIATVKTENSGLAIGYANGMVSATDACSIEMFNISGMSVAKAAGNNLSTATLSGGMYIIIATDAEGNTTAKKLVIK